MNDTPEIVHFNFKLVPAHKPEDLHDNMRSSIARNLPTVSGTNPPHDGILAIAGGGPSLEDTLDHLTGYVAAVNGSLGYLLSKGIVPQMCGICDPSPHMADIIEADPRVTYFVASIVHPSVFDKLINAGCRVYRWNMSAIPGGQELLDIIEPNYHLIGGGSTMGLRWITLGYTMGFRTFHIHGMDCSFRGKASHAYPDHQDHKDWIGFEGYQTRPNFIGQLVDFLSWLERLKEEDVEPVKIKVFGDGLLQTKFKAWKEHNPGWHEGNIKPEHRSLTADFVWPATDKMAQASIKADVSYMDKFLSHISRRGTVVQAGGNVGVYPAHLAKHFREVHTFEPDPANYTCLAANIQKVKGTIAAHHAALGEYDGTCGVKRLDLENMGMVQVIEGGEIPMRRIDTLELPECDLIWLDIEGYELNALIGAEQTIEKYWPAIIIEDNGTSERMGIPHNAATEWLYHHGYINAIKYGQDRLLLPTAVAP